MLWGFSALGCTFPSDLWRRQRSFLSLTAGRGRKTCPELQLKCWISKKKKNWLWFAVLCSTMETISLVSPHFTVFLRGGVKWHISSARLCNSADVLKFDSPWRSPTERKKKKVSCLLKKLMTCSARLSRRMAATNLKLSGCSLTASQNSHRDPVWFFF